MRIVWSESLINVRNFLLEVRELPQIKSWQNFSATFERVERELNWGTTGWATPLLYDPVFEFLDRVEAPEEPRAAINLHYGLATFDWERVAAASDILVGRVSAGERWVRPTVLLDAAVVAYLKVGRPLAARTALQLLGPKSGREASNLRNRLLSAMVQDALAAQGGPEAF